MAIKLKAARVNADLSQAEAAKRLGIGKGTLANYERYITKPDIEMGKKIATLYGMELDEIAWNNG